MKRVLIAAFLVTAVLAQAEQQDAKVVVGAARFTVIAPECIRLEYAADGKFVDANPCLLSDATRPGTISN